MTREVIFSKDKLLSGVAKLAGAVGSTLGPVGQPALIMTDNGAPFITKDGVTVARFFKLSDKMENLAATIVSQSAQATVQAAGDGTTTSIILADEIIRRGHDAESSAVTVVKGIEAATKDVVKHLQASTLEMTKEYIKKIAYISSNNDEEASGLITKAFVESGDDGVVEVQFDMNNPGLSLDMKAGSMFPQGFTNQAYINNMKGRTCDLVKPFVLVSSVTIDDHTKIIQLLEHAIKADRPLIVIADTDDNFEENFLANVQKKSLKGTIIKPGAYATTDMLKDLADLLGAKYFDNSSGNNLEHVDSSFLGEADYAIIGDSFSLFTLEKPGNVSSNIEILKDLIEGEKSTLIKKGYQQRLSMLNGKHATIKVGAPTQAAMGEVKDRIDDAVFAVGAAQKFGYLPGGGVALRDAAMTLYNTQRVSGGKGFEEGYKVLLDSLIAPFNLILKNAGIEHPDKDLHLGIGYDASNGELVNMIAAGIIDPSLVAQQAVVNAASSAGALLSTNATLIIEDEA